MLVCRRQHLIFCEVLNWAHHDMQPQEILQPKITYRHGSPAGVPSSSQTASSPATEQSVPADK